jgi:hypothetical protein
MRLFQCMIFNVTVAPAAALAPGADAARGATRTAPTTNKLARVINGLDRCNESIGQFLLTAITHHV